MVSDEYISFFKKFGYKVIRDGELCFFEVRSHVYQLLPAFYLDRAGRQTMKQVQRKQHLPVLRYFDKTTGGSSQTTAIYNLYAPYSLNDIESKARNQTRRGLERFTVHEIPETPQSMAQMQALYFENAEKIKAYKSDASLQQRWNRWSHAMFDSPKVKVWGAFSGDTLGAFAVVIQEQDWAEILLHRSSDAGRKDYANNALVYELAMYYFGLGTRFISYGLESFDDSKAGLSHFKRNMGFKKEVLNEYIMVHPRWFFLAPVANPRFRKTLYRLFGKV